MNATLALLKFSMNIVLPLRVSSSIYVVTIMYGNVASTLLKVHRYTSLFCAILQRGTTFMTFWEIPVVFPEEVYS